MGYSTVRMKSDRSRLERDFYQTPKGLIYSSLQRFMEDENLERWHTCCWDVLDVGCADGRWLEGTLNQFTYASSEENTCPWNVGIDIEKPDYINDNIIDEFIHDDYTTYSFGDSLFDLILGNPPFRLAEEFVHKSLELVNFGGYIYFLFRLAFLEGRNRQLTLFEKFPPKKVYVLTRRPSFFSTKKNAKTTDTLAYAMFLWKHGWHGKTELDWLYWECDS